MRDTFDWHTRHLTPSQRAMPAADGAVAAEHLARAPSVARLSLGSVGEGWRAAGRPGLIAELTASAASASHAGSASCEAAASEVERSDAETAKAVASAVEAKVGPEV